MCELAVYFASTLLPTVAAPLPDPEELDEAELSVESWPSSAGGEKGGGSTADEAEHELELLRLLLEADETVLWLALELELLLAVLCLAGSC